MEVNQSQIRISLHFYPNQGRQYQVLKQPNLKCQQLQLWAKSRDSKIYSKFVVNNRTISKYKHTRVAPHARLQCHQIDGQTSINPILLTAVNTVSGLQNNSLHRQRDG